MTVTITIFKDKHPHFFCNQSIFQKLRMHIGQIKRWVNHQCLSIHLFSQSLQEFSDSKHLIHLLRELFEGWEEDCRQVQNKNCD